MTTQAQNAANIAAAVAIATGRKGYNAMLLARATFANALSFDYVRACNQTEAPPVADSATDAELRAILGEVAPEPPIRLNADDILNAHAAAYMLLVHGVNSIDPETGKRPEWMKQPGKNGRNRMATLPDAVVQHTDSNTLRNIERAKVAAESLRGPDGKNVDVSARVTALKAEGDALAAELRAACSAQWLSAVKDCRDWELDDLAELAASTIAANGRDPLDEIERAALAYQKAARDRFEAGKFASIPPDVYALAQAAIEKARRRTA